MSLYKVINGKLHKRICRKSVCRNGKVIKAKRAKAMCFWIPVIK